MLCDDLVTHLAPGSGMDIKSVIPLIQGSQKFVLSPNFAAVADALSTDYAGLVRVFERCRLPYPCTWIEVAHLDRPGFAAAPIHAPEFQIRPRRVGFLLTSTRDDLSAWKAHLFWNLEDAVCSCAALAMEYDMCRPFTNVTHAEDRPYENVMLRRQPTAHPGWNMANMTVRTAMVNHTHPAWPDYGLPSPAGIPLDEIERFYTLVSELARSDWAGEAAYLLAVIGLLNARNAVEVELVDNKKLNKARVKRGKLPLLSHKILKIAHRQIKRVPGEGRTGDREPMRQHFCRGHFKARKSGIFFWSPHLRGDPSRGRVEKEYEL